MSQTRKEPEFLISHFQKRWQKQHLTILKVSLNGRKIGFSHLWIHHMEISLWASLFCSHRGISWCQRPTLKLVPHKDMSTLEPLPMWRSMTRESQCIANMVLLQIGCPPLPLAQYMVTLLQQKKVLREVKCIPLSTRSWQRWLSLHHHQTATVFPEHFQGRETVNLKLRVDLSWTQQTPQEDCTLRERLQKNRMRCKQFLENLARS